MCGLVGYMDLRERHIPSPVILERMAAALAHRGPDSDGFAIHENVGIGFRRLSIVDPIGGDQPLYNEDRSIALCCNGEILNHQRLRHELLAKGHRFGTASDAETLVHLYEEHGQDLVHHVTGQFSFAIHDRRRRSLLLARDRVGITPLHYAIVAGLLVFGSEIKALLRHPEVPREVDLHGLDQVISLPGLVSPRTMFRGIASLPPAHLLVAENGSVRIRRYWDLDYPTLEEADETDANTYEHLDRLSSSLTGAVETRIPAEVRHAYYLSGGLDSSLITTVAAMLRPEARVSTFSAVFDDQDLSERHYQQLVAGKLGTDHTEIRVTPDDLLDELPQAVHHSECPLKETYNVASLRLSRAVREHGAKVVLSGEGADELFAGYVGYKFDQMRADARDPNRPLSDEEQLRARLWGSPDLAYGRNLTELEATKRRLFSPAVASQMPPFDYVERLGLNRKKVTGRHILHQRSYLDFTLRLPDHLLGDHGDRMTLANSVEARYPFLDEDVIECARLLPPDLKLRDYEEKYAIKLLAGACLPAEIAEREKFAFQANSSPDLIALDRDWVDDALSPARIGREGYFNPGAVSELRTRYSDGNRRLELAAEDDLLIVVLTFGVFLDAFALPHLT